MFLQQVASNIVPNVHFKMDFLLRWLFTVDTTLVHPLFMLKWFIACYENGQIQKTGLKMSEKGKCKEKLRDLQKVSFWTLKYDKKVKNRR